MVGCGAGTNKTFNSLVRESGEVGSSKRLRCIELTPSTAERMNPKLEEYDGWKMVYISELNSRWDGFAPRDIVVCFEQPTPWAKTDAGE